MRVLGVVLAAGAGRRIGGPKALLPCGTGTFLQAVAAGLRRPGVEAVLAVLGCQAGRVRSVLPEGVETVDNPGWEAGMLGSVQAGLEAAERRGADAVLLHPVDHPRLSPATVDAVVAALREGAPIAVPSWQMRRGHPAGFARSTWEALRQAPPARGARAVLAGHPEWVVHVPGDPGCLAGVDTPEDYLRVLGVPLPRP